MQRTATPLQAFTFSMTKTLPLSEPSAPPVAAADLMFRLRPHGHTFPHRMEAGGSSEEKLPRLTTRRVFMARGFGPSLLLGSVGACRVGSRTTKEGHEFFDPADLPWHVAPGFSSGAWERIVSGGRDEGVSDSLSALLDPGSGNDAVVMHDFWEEMSEISSPGPSSAEHGYTAGCVAVRPLDCRTALSTRPVGVSPSRFATGYPDEGHGIEVACAPRLQSADAANSEGIREQAGYPLRGSRFPMILKHPTSIDARPR